MYEHGRWARMVVAVAALGGAVVASPGCVSLDGVQAGQSDVVGDVTISGTVCVAGSAGCANVDNVENTAAEGMPVTQSGQVLVGFRVPAAVTPPATLTADRPAVTFAPSADYTAELERLSPAGPGRRWAGYISSAFLLESAADPDIGFSSTWTLPRGADGAPFAGPLRYRPVAGWRFALAGANDTRPVVCDAASLGVVSETGADSTVCVDSPLLATIAGPDLSLETRDLGILTGAAATGPAGTTVRVPFTARYAGGAGPAVAFALTAATTVPGARATVGPTGLVPQTDSTTPVSVAVAVPAGTAPGTYDVTLTATLGAQTRVRSGTLTVTAPPVAAVRLTGSLPGRLTFLAARARGVRVVVRSSRAGRAVIRLVQGGRALAATTVTLRPGANAVVLRSRALVAGAYRVTVTVTATGGRAALRGTLRAR